MSAAASVAPSDEENSDLVIWFSQNSCFDDSDPAFECDYDYGCGDYVSMIYMMMYISWNHLKAVISGLSFVQPCHLT